MFLRTGAFFSSILSEFLKNLVALHLLLRLLNAENEICSTMALENFILGFRLGMRIAIESLDENDGNLTMTQEEGGTYHGKETGQRRR